MDSTKALNAKALQSAREALPMSGERKATIIQCETEAEARLMSALDQAHGQIARLQQELSDCKAERDANARDGYLCGQKLADMEMRAEAAEQKFEAASEAYENLQFDAGAERQRANAAEAREKQVRAALEPFMAMPDEAKIVIYSARGFQERELWPEEVAAIRALGQTELGEQT